MAKQGMKRPEQTHMQPRNAAAAVPEIQGKAKSGKKHVNPMIAGTSAPSRKVFHTASSAAEKEEEKPISDVYPVIDNDLARDNIENDIPDADLQDL